MINILFVLTSHETLGSTGKKTGFWTAEFANPYYSLLEKGAAITIATPKGGKAPIDPFSDTLDNQTDDSRRFMSDLPLQKKIDETHVLADMESDDFDAVFYPGGHGPLWDLANDEVSIRLIESFNQQNKPIAFVCHAPAALKGVKNKDGSAMVKGRKVTGFSNTEEQAVGLAQVVPFLIEDMLTDLGGIYSKAVDWEPYVISDGNLLTGQNPASSQGVAEKLLQMVEK